MRLLAFYHDQMKLEDNLDYNLTAFAFRIFSEDGMLSDYMKIVNENEVIFDSEKMVESFSKLIMDVSNNTRRYMFRGHKPIELHELDFPVVQHKNKVYPNDPCPCGSGKKFKKCCGNQRKD